MLARKADAAFKQACALCDVTWIRYATGGDAGATSENRIIELLPSSHDVDKKGSSHVALQLRAPSHRTAAKWLVALRRYATGGDAGATSENRIIELLPSSH